MPNRSLITRRLVTIPLAALLLALFVAPVVLFRLSRALTVYATPETQSQFLRAYTPKRVFDRFRDAKYSGSTGSGGGHGAGIGFATHTRTIDQELVMLSSEQTAIMTALDADMVSFVTATGAQIISDTGNDRDGIRLRYVLGKSAGTVTIKPPDPIADSGRAGLQVLGPGEVHVRVRIAMEETWCKSGKPMSPAKQSLLARLLM